MHIYVYIYIDICMYVGCIARVVHVLRTFTAWDDEASCKKFRPLTIDEAQEIRCVDSINKLRGPLYSQRPCFTDVHRGCGGP